MVKAMKKYFLLIFITSNLFSVEIRLAMEHEIKDVAELYYTAWHETFDKLCPQSLVQQRTRENCLAQWQEYYRKKGKHFTLVAVEQATIAGVLFAGQLDGDCPIHYGAAYNSEIDKLYVASSCKNKEIGAQLLEAGLTLLRLLGFKGTVVHSLATNESANTLYKKHGGVLMGYYDDAMNVYGFDLRKNRS